MRQEELNKILEDHKNWLDGNGGKRADLRGADLRWAGLQGADLQGADLDFSVWPLWCGSKGVIVDIKIVRQLLAHVACLTCDDPEFAEVIALIMPYAKKSHRAKDLGLVEEE